MIELRSVAKSFAGPRPRVVFANVTLSVAAGEMVAILWARGHTGATVRLEHLWHRLCATESFTLFCAYPKIGFTQDGPASIREICAAHSAVVPG